LYAFSKGVETEGGNMEETLVMNPNDTGAISKAIDRVNLVKPDYVYVLLSGENARSFILQYHANPENKTPLLTTPFVTEETNLPQMGQYAIGLETVSPWIEDLSNTTNREFAKKYMKEYRAQPDMFAVLGYETGLITYQALANCKGDFSGDVLSQNLMAASIDSPRGKLTVNTNTGYTETPMYRVRIDGGLLSSMPKPIEEDTLESLAANHSQFSELDNNMRSGWLNPYLFV
jgi:branched-chain amino acid transport system substrate-binding protein